MEVPSTKYILSNCLIFSVISTIVIAQIPQRYTLKNPCTSKETCHDCIETPSCAWCFDPAYTERPRCFQPSTSEEPNAGCSEEFVLNPDNVMSYILDEELSNVRVVEGGGSSVVGVTVTQHSESHYNESSEWSSKGGSSSSMHSSGRIVQVAPQRISLKLRAKQTHTIFMAYKQAQDYPLDLYYLMDLSSSMHDDKDNLSKLGSKLAETMRRLTSNFRLGFGSFVDKVVMPYVSTLAHKLRQPCEICVAPYGFRHHMTLSNNTHMFSTEVQRANVSGNLDAPEGGFDAIMQAVVCRNNIGWREQARRLLVFSTDASFHYAGDGKLGGIVKPNDGQCHMSRDGFYTESSSQDYPSIEQLNLSIKNNSINVIFAVTKEIYAIYEELSRTIEGASCGKLEGDSSNIVDLIREQYEKISSTVKMKHDASNDVNIKFFSSCLNKSGIMEATNQCDGIKVGNTVKFKIDIQIPKCPENPKDHFQTIKIYPVGINESLIVDLEMLCQCDCEKPGNKYYEKNSRHCSQQGVYRCGVCECNPGAFGPKCECTAEGDLKNVTMNCIEPGTTIECSGRGECTCGHCICKPRPNSIERIYGKYCECDNFSCERHNGKVCSEHGSCDCGVCQCDPGWMGPNCACRNSTDSCKPFGSTDDVLCSGHGTCECGGCVCEVTAEGRYSGKFCEKCPVCPDRCEEFKECVQCQQYKTGPLTKEKCASCKTFVPISVKKLTANEEEGEVMCQGEDEDGCRFKYVYFYDEKQTLQVRAQENRECPIEVQIPAIILGVIAAVVLIGMAVLLLWKLLTTIHDRREFAKFEKEKMMAKWDTGENPIYKQATSTFKNPTYSGKG